jgi:hypothetical protein
LRGERAFFGERDLRPERRDLRGERDLRPERLFGVAIILAIAFKTGVAFTLRERRERLTERDLDILLLRKKKKKQKIYYLKINFFGSGSSVLFCFSLISNKI